MINLNITQNRKQNNEFDPLDTTSGSRVTRTLDEELEAIRNGTFQEEEEEEGEKKSLDYYLAHPQNIPIQDTQPQEEGNNEFNIFRMLANAGVGFIDYLGQVVLNNSALGAANTGVAMIDSGHDPHGWIAQSIGEEEYRKLKNQHAYYPLAEGLAAAGAGWKDLWDDVGQSINGDEQSAWDRIGHGAGTAGGFATGSALIDTGITAGVEAAGAVNPLLGAAVYLGGKAIKGSLEAGTEAGSIFIDRYAENPNLFRDPEKLRNALKVSNQNFVANVIPDTLLDMAGDKVSGMLGVKGLKKKIVKGLAGEVIKENVQEAYQTAAERAAEKTFQSGDLSWSNFSSNLLEEYKNTIFPYTDEQGNQHSGYFWEQMPEVSASTLLSAGVMTAFGLPSPKRNGHIFTQKGREQMRLRSDLEDLANRSQEEVEEDNRKARETNYNRLKAEREELRHAIDSAYDSLQPNPTATDEKAVAEAPAALDKIAQMEKKLEEYDDTIANFWGEQTDVISNPVQDDAMSLFPDADEINQTANNPDTIQPTESTTPLVNILGTNTNTNGNNLENIQNNEPDLIADVPNENNTNPIGSTQWNAQQNNLTEDFDDVEDEPDADLEDNYSEQYNQSAATAGNNVNDGSLDVGTFVFGTQSRDYSFNVVLTQHNGTNGFSEAFNNRLRRWNGRYIEIRNSQGKVIATYYPAFGTFNFSPDIDARHTLRWKQKFEYDFRTNLQSYLNGGGMLDESGNLKPDGNEAFRRRWAATIGDNENSFNSNEVQPEDIDAPEMGSLTVSYQNDDGTETTKDLSVVLGEFGDNMPEHKQYFGKYFDVMDGGRIIARYAPRTNSIKFTTHKDAGRMKQAVMEQLRRKAKSFMRKAGFLDANGKFIPDGNEAYREKRKAANNIPNSIPAPTANTPTDRRRKSFGKTAQVRTIKGTTANIRYKVVDANSLIVSTNEDGSPNSNFPQKLQPRQRNREASYEQVVKISGSLDPELLAESRLASDGAPVVGVDGVVESGNGRVMAIRMAYRNGTANNYYNWIKENVARFGLTPDDIAGIRNPVLVRERITPVDRVKFTREANESSTSGMSMTEHAVNDAKNITTEMLSLFDPEKSLLANKEFLQAFSRIVPQSEKNDFYQKDGKISKAGLDRVLNALIAKAYNDTGILDRLNEIYDDDIKNVSNALVQAAAKMAVFENGGYSPSISIREDIAQAVRKLAQLKSEGLSIADYLSQITMFNDDNISDTATKLLQFFDRNKRSTKRITQALIHYAESAMGEAKQGQTLMFEDSARDKETILDESIKVAESKSSKDSKSETYSQKVQDTQNDNSNKQDTKNDNSYTTTVKVIGTDGKEHTLTARRKSFGDKHSQAKQYHGDYIEFTDENGRVVARWSPYSGQFQMANVQDADTLQPQIVRSLMNNLNDYLRTFGYLDEYGRLIDDGNKKFRSKYRARQDTTPEGKKTHRDNLNTEQKKKRKDTRSLWQRFKDARDEKKKHESVRKRVQARLRHALRKVTEEREYQSRLRAKEITEDIGETYTGPLELTKEDKARIRRETDFLAEMYSHVITARIGAAAHLAGMSVEDYHKLWKLRFRVADIPNTRGQTEYGKPKFDDDGNLISTAETIIYLTKLHDESTVLHEFAHIFLKDYQDLIASVDDLPSKVKKDWLYLTRWLGISDIDPKSTKQTRTEEEDNRWKNAHEKFAVAFEQYYMTGKAPKSRLQRVFNYFKNWLSYVYKAVKDIKYEGSDGRRHEVELSPEVKRIFGRMLKGSNYYIPSNESSRARFERTNNPQQGEGYYSQTADGQDNSNDIRNTDNSNTEPTSIGRSNSSFLFPKDIERYEQLAFHGTIHKILNNKFSLNFMGTGAGSQNFGWGLYFAQSPEISNSYRRNGRTIIILDKNGMPIRADTATMKRLQEQLSPYTPQELNNFASTRKEAIKVFNYLIEELQDKIQEAKEGDVSETTISQYYEEISQLSKAIDILKQASEFVGANGNLYFVDIPENDALLDWDAEEQPEKVKRAMQRVIAKLKKYGITPDAIEKLKNSKTGGNFYYALQAAVQPLVDEGKFKSDKHGVITRADVIASLLLNQAGIPGHRYWDRSSRTKKHGTHNFVIWNTDMIKLLGLSSDSDEDAKQYFREQAAAKLRQKPETYKQIIGTKGAKRLDETEGVTTRMDNLAIANSLERKKLSPEKIWLATGWQRGKDDKWRYEIMDGKLYSRGISALRKTYNEFQSIHKKFKDNPNYTPTRIEYDRMDELSETYKRLYQIFDNEDLFYAYPDLRDIRVYFKDFAGGVAAGYDPEFDIISLSPHIKDAKELKVSLIHEIQHAIQAREEFSNGSSFYPDSDKYYSKAKRELERILGTLDNSSVEKVKDVLEERFSGSRVIAVLKAMRLSDNELDAYDKAKKPASIMQKRKIYLFNRYMRNTGEVEARNTETRADWNKNKRQNTPLDQSEDISRSKQIVSEIYSQIVGRKGAEKIDKVIGAQWLTYNLDLAEKMKQLGFKPRTIRRVTGWELGHEGKWKFEAPDGNLKDNITLKATEPDFDPFEDIPFGFETQPFARTTLGKVFNSTELFAAYPQLKKASVTFVQGDDFEANGIHYPSGSTDRDLSITLEGDFNFDGNNLYPNSNENTILTLLHEIQHAIQRIEGFAGGSNMDLAINNSPAVKDYDRKIDALQRELEKLYHEPNFKTAEEALFGDNPQSQEYNDLEEKLFALIDEKEQFIQNAKNDGTARNLYERSAGETEARNVMTRHGMTKQQRRDTLLRDTEDFRHDELLDENGEAYAQSANTDDSHLTPEAKRQIATIRTQYQNTPQWLKAPNGKDTKLNELQWLLVRTPNFKAWFGDWEHDPQNASKVLDENGEPLVVYHGTTVPIESLRKFKRGTEGWLGPGIYFTWLKMYANHFSDKGDAGIMHLFLNLRNPLRLVQKNPVMELLTLLYGDKAEAIYNERYNDVYSRNLDKFNELYQDEVDNPFVREDIDRYIKRYIVTRDEIDRLLAQGYDGIAWDFEYSVIKPTKIKSATRNNGNFGTSEEEIYKQIAARRKHDMDVALTRSRPDMTPEQRADAIIEIEKLGESVRQGGNPKVEKLATHWLLKGHIILPEDNYKILDAIKISEQQHFDPMSFDDPNEILAKYTIKESRAERRINPDTVQEFSHKVEYPNGITVYTVDDTQEGQAAVRAIIDTHWGKEANPWCLAARGENGDLINAWDYWSNTYNTVPKRIAFKDGKLLAFCASDNGNNIWWDREDEEHQTIPYPHIVQKNGETIEYGYDEENGQLCKEKETLADGTTRTFYKNGKQANEWLPDGTYHEWYENGNPRVEELPDGTRRTWYKNGGLQSEALPNRAYREWYENGTPRQEKLPDGTDRRWHENGKQANEWLPDGTCHEWYENGNPRVEALPDKTVRNWYENGQLEREELPDRTRRTWYENGNQESEDLPDGTYRYWYENGNPSSETLPDRTKRDWYDNGQIRYEHLPDRTQNYWYENGQMKRQKLPDGTQREWYDNGQITSEYLPDGTERNWYKNGQLKNEKLPDGTRYVFFEDGELQYEEHPEKTALPSDNGLDSKNRTEIYNQSANNNNNDTERSAESSLMNNLSIAQQMERNSFLTPEKYDQLMHHGTKNIILGNRFNLQYLDTGEGRQFFGYGIYLAEAFDTAESYRDAGMTDEEIESRKGNHYFADGPENDILLNWDAKLSEQPEKVLDILQNSGILATLYGDEYQDNKEFILNYVNGKMLYEDLASLLHGEQRRRYREYEDKQMLASMKLNEVGIPGLRYLDSNSRDKKSATHNFVIWNTDTLRLLGLTDDSEQDAQDYYRAEDYYNAMLDSLDNDSDIVEYDKADYEYDMEHIDDIANAHMDALDNDSETYDQIIGEQGAKKLDKAENSNGRMDNLRTAQQMEHQGIPAKKIWLATGWQRGADGKWRYEILDGKIKNRHRFNRKNYDRYTGLLKRASETFEKEFERLLDMYNNRLITYGEFRTQIEQFIRDNNLDGDKHFDFSGFTDKEIKRFKELEKLYEDTTLKDVFEAPELYKAYPKLQHINVEISSFLPVDTLASFDPINDTIMFNLQYIDAPARELRGTIIHEVQHVIQTFEGFASGSNTAQWKTNRSGKVNIMPFLRRNFSQSARRILKNISPELQKKFRSLRLKEKKMNERNFAALLRKTLSEDERKVYMQWHNVRSILQNINDGYKASGVPMQFEPETAYYATSGEVEARNAETRSGWGERKRHNTTLDASEDMKHEREFQILLNVQGQSRLHHNDSGNETYSQSANTDTTESDNIVRSINDFLTPDAKAQVDSLRKQYKGTPQWLKAPNGKNSKLNELQWLLVRTPNFKQWFGDWESDPKNASKILDENGEPLVVYHGTSKGGFSVFNTAGDEFFTYDTGAWFTSSKEGAEVYSHPTFGKKPPTSAIYPVFLNIRNPYIYEANGADWDSLGTITIRDNLNGWPIYVGDPDIPIGNTEQAWDYINEYLLHDEDGNLMDNEDEDGNPIYSVESDGLETTDDIARAVWKGKLGNGNHDGVIIKEVTDPDFPIDVYVVPKNTQIKSSERNNGEYSSNPDIYKQTANTGSMENENFVRSVDDFLTPEVKARIDAIRKQYKGTPNWLKAPNGKDTKLTELQWLLVRTDNFKQWFGDWENDPADASVAVDENGEPRVVYHGSLSEPFSVFDTDGSPSLGSFFTSELYDAEGYAGHGKGHVYPVFLNIRTPYYFDSAYGREWNNLDTFIIKDYENDDYIETDDYGHKFASREDAEDYIADTLDDPDFMNYSVETKYGYNTTDEIVQAVFNNEIDNSPEDYYDSVIFEGIIDGHSEHPSTVYVVRYSEDIKSATRNNGEYSSNPDIYKQSAQGLEYGNSLRYDISVLTPEAKKQIAIVRDKYKGTSKWLKAPNSQKSNLNELQWLLVRTPNFKNWFGDWENDPQNASKVIDENGEPLVLYHRTERGNNFSVFRENSGGIHFGTRRQADDRAKGKLFAVFLNVRNPDRTFDQRTSWNYYVEWTKNAGYDGIVYPNEVEGVEPGTAPQDSWIVFTPNQIKSATRNNGEYSLSNDEIYRQSAATDTTESDNVIRSQDDFLTPEVKARIDVMRKQYQGTKQWLKAPNGKASNLNELQWLLVRTENFKRWFGDWERAPQNASKVLDENGEPLVVYHGSDSEEVSVFNTKGKNHSKGAGTFFSDAQGVAETFISGKLSENKLYPVFLNIRNPYIVGGNGNFWSTLYEYHVYDNYRERNMFLKHDGSNFMSKDDAANYIAHDLHDPDNKRYSVRESYTMTTDDIARFAWKFRKGQGKRFDGVIIRKVYDVGYPTTNGVNPVSDEFIIPKSVQIKSATRNNGEYSSNPDIYKQAIGEKGAEATDKANEDTALMDNLRMAQELEGRGFKPRTIKRATGWERGAYDKKWRYEIPDGNIRPNAKFHLVENSKHKVWKATLKDIFDAPELYRAYPNLANIRVYAMLKDMNGLYSPKFGGVIKIPKKYVNRNGDIVKKHVEAYMVQLRTTLLHEIQHAIQCIEGFALGSIPQNFRKEFEDTKDQRKQSIAEIEKKIAEIKEVSGYNKFLKEKNEITTVVGNNSTNNSTVDIEEFWENSPYGKEYKRLLALWKKLIHDNPGQKYLRTPGEREARNIETRQNFSAEQRKNTLLSETEDTRGRYKDENGRFYDEIENETFYQSANDIQDNPFIETYRQPNSFDNLRAETAYRNLQGRRKPDTPVKSKWSTVWKSIKDSARAFRADFPLLAGDEAKAKGLTPAREYLRIMNRNVSAKAHIVAENLHKYLHGMSAEQLDVFSRVMMLNDLYAFRRNNPNTDLPFGYSTEELNAERSRFVALAKADKKVSNAIIAANAENKKIRQDLTDLALKLGLKSFASRLKMDDLFLIQYANLLDGSDFNSNYIQATGEMRITMLQDLERLTAIDKIRAKYDRKTELVQQYGTKWRAHIPKGYSMFNPLAERFIFTAHSLTENVLSAAIKNSAEALGLSDNTVDALLSKISEPFGTQLMVLPDPLTKTLKKLTAPTQRGFFGKAFKSITTAWKQFALYAIPRAVKFNFRNLTGDFDSLLAGNPSALKFVPQAVRELAAAYYGDSTNISKELSGFQSRGGALTVQSAQEIGEYKELKQFADLISELETQGAPAWEKLPRQAWSVLDKFLWSGIQKFSDFREQWFRYATYLDYLQQMQNNNGIPNNWGASDKDEVMAIDDIRDRAFKMANELLGAYDQVSEMGRKMREILFPFYSFIEVNAKRYGQLLKNGLTEDIADSFASKFLKGFMANIPYFGYKFIETMFFIHLFGLLARAFNWLWAGDAESKLPKYVQDTPHLTFGQDKDGNVYYFNRIGSVGDLLEWIGFDSTSAMLKDVKQIFDGSMSIGDFAKQVAKAPFNKFISALTPFIKTPVELLTGYSAFPDITNPRPIKDKGESLAKSNSLSWPYKWATGQDIDYKKDITNMFIDTRKQRTRNAEQDNYFEMRERVRAYRENVLGKGSSGSFNTSERSDALRNLRAALRNNDKEAARKYINQYLNLEGKQSNLHQAIKRMHPLSGLSRRESNEFIETLSEQEQKNLERAINYYESLMDLFKETY